MKSLALVATLALLSALTPTAASACAMRKISPPVEMVAQVHFRKAAAAEDRGQTRVAIREYERAMNAEGPARVRAEAAVRAARLHAAAHHASRVESRLRRAVALDRRHAEAHAALGRHLLGKADAEAISMLRKAIALNAEGAADLNLDLALASIRLHQREAAQAALQQARMGGADPARVAAVEAALAATPAQPAQMALRL